MARQGVSGESVVLIGRLMTTAPLKRSTWLFLMLLLARLALGSHSFRLKPAHVHATGSSVTRGLARTIWRKRPREHISQVGGRLCSSFSGDDTSIRTDAAGRRRVLGQCLMDLHIDAEGLDKAALSSIVKPTDGYDGRYGKSAIRAYRSFLYPKKSAAQNDRTKVDDLIQLEATASRVARQIEFLLKRHESHLAEFVRHHDAAEKEAASRTTFPLVLILDNMRSAFNVGSIFRTADAAGCSLVITTGITAHPFGSGSDKLQKSALGAELVVPSRHFVTTREAIDFVRQDLPSHSLIGMETTEQSVCYTEVDYNNQIGSQGIALILGNEVTGVDTNIMPELDAIVQVPMFGTKNSLNVATCAPIFLFEVLRQWRESGRADVLVE